MRNKYLIYYEMKAITTKWGASKIKLKRNIKRNEQLGIEKFGVKLGCRFFSSSFFSFLLLSFRSYKNIKPTTK